MVPREAQHLRTRRCSTRTSRCRRRSSVVLLVGNNLQQGPRGLISPVMLLRQRNLSRGKMTARSNFNHKFFVVQLLTNKKCCRRAPHSLPSSLSWTIPKPSLIAWLRLRFTPYQKLFRQIAPSPKLRATSKPCYHSSATRSLRRKSAHHSLLTQQYQLAPPHHLARQHLPPSVP